MFERFTEHARGVAIHAQEEARRLGHPRIGSEHVLLGLLREPAATGGRALDGLGIDLDGARADVARLAGPDPTGFAREDVEALQSVGIDLDEVRRSVEDAFGEGTRRGSSASEGSRPRRSATRRRAGSGAAATGPAGGPDRPGAPRTPARDYGASGSSTVADGSSMRTIAPPPSALPALTRPPCDSATCRTIASPRPEPGFDRAALER